MEFKPRMPVFIANIHRQHGFNISRNKQTVATVLSNTDGRCHVRFKDNSTAFIGSQYLELATEQNHSNVLGWKQHLIAVKTMKSNKLIQANSSLVELCNGHGVMLSVSGGEIVLVDNDCVDNYLVINDECHL